MKPNNYGDYIVLKADNELIYHQCIKCNKEFSPLNIHTTAGWRETQISGLCEICWDELFEEDEE